MVNLPREKGDLNERTLGQVGGMVVKGGGDSVMEALPLQENDKYGCNRKNGVIKASKLSS